MLYEWEWVTDMEKIKQLSICLPACVRACLPDLPASFQRPPHPWAMAPCRPSHPTLNLINFRVPRTNRVSQVIWVTKNLSFSKVYFPGKWGFNHCDRGWFGADSYWPFSQNHMIETLPNHARMNESHQRSEWGVKCHILTPKRKPSISVSWDLHAQKGRDLLT